MAVGLGCACAKTIHAGSGHNRHHDRRGPCKTLVLAEGTGYQYSKDQANRQKHGVDFRTAAKVFLGPYVIEFDDLDARGELRFNAIGQVDGRILFVTYTMRGDVVRILSARGAEPHEKRKYHEI